MFITMTEQCPKRPTPRSGLNSANAPFHNIKSFSPLSSSFNEYEPVDSSAAAIAAQGMLRLGRYLKRKGDKEESEKYFQTGLTIASGLFSDAYLSLDLKHQGLLLHSVYHRPNGWDYIPEHGKIPFGESSMWGDYHALELALYLQRIALDKPYYTFFPTEGGIK